MKIRSFIQGGQMQKTNKPKVSKIQIAYLKALRKFQDKQGQNPGQQREMMIEDTDTYHTPYKGVIDVLSKESLESHVEDVK